MSRYAPDQKISLLSWRMAMAGLIIVTGAVMAAALLIARQGQALPAALTPAHLDENWAIFVNDEWTWQEHALPAARWIGVVADAQAASDPFEARFDQIAGRP